MRKKMHCRGSKFSGSTGEDSIENAGVINGMTATTFQPNGLLTRAQIAKIIWALGNI